MILPTFWRFSILLQYTEADALDTTVRLLRISMIILFRYRIIFFVVVEIITKKTVIIILNAKETEKTIGEKMETNSEPMSQYTKNTLAQSRIDISQTANVIKHTQYKREGEREGENERNNNKNFISNIKKEFDIIRASHKYRLTSARPKQ